MEIPFVRKTAEVERKNCAIGGSPQGEDITLGRHGMELNNDVPVSPLGKEKGQRMPADEGK